MKMSIIIFSATAAIALAASCSRNTVDYSINTFGDALGSDSIRVVMIDSVQVATPYIGSRQMGVLYLRGDFLRQAPEKSPQWKLRSDSDTMSLLYIALGEGEETDSLRESITRHVGNSYYERMDPDHAEVVFLEPSGRALVLVAIDPTATRGGNSR